jgi:hypothetical protein
MLADMKPTLSRPTSPRSAARQFDRILGAREERPRLIDESSTGMRQRNVRTMHSGPESGASRRPKEARCPAEPQGTDIQGDRKMKQAAVPVVTDMKVIPVAGRASMLLNLSGAHSPFFIRNIVQGFLNSRAVEADEFAELLAQPEAQVLPVLV